jgi:acyl-coenzyme A synthetase/AMP-(fatty) acid ligase/acyl carrier protein
MRNLIAWQLERSPTGLKTVQYGSLSFDASFHDIFATLVDGGHLYVVSESARKDPVELLDILRAHRIERIFLPFVALQLLAETAGGLAPDALREVCTAGEQLRVTSALREFFASIPACRLENYYGPTEAHVVTAHGLTGDSREWPELPPIGRPISNTLIHVLDRHLSPVPIGAVGELWIGGECLADGYWNRPDLTEERFRQVVIGGRSERLYRSGDLSKLLPDGAIQFLGRADDQVKIRGFRVEPAEIEATLESHPSVRQAAVTSRSTDRGARLVAYYVPAPGVELTVKALQDFLRGLMPDYMVPAAFVQLQEMPVTPSGKLDRRALPAEDVVARRRDRAPVAPGDEVEAALLAIWQDVLGIADIGTEDDFFDVGGHSLAAVQVVARVESACGVRVPVAALLDQTTIVRLAAYVGTLRAVLAVDGRPAGSTGGARDEFVF